MCKFYVQQFGCGPRRPPKPPRKGVSTCKAPCKAPQLKNHQCFQKYPYGNVLKPSFEKASDARLPLTKPTSIPWQQLLSPPSFRRTRPVHFVDYSTLARGKISPLFNEKLIKPMSSPGPFPLSGLGLRSIFQKCTPNCFLIQIRSMEK